MSAENVIDTFLIVHYFDFLKCEQTLWSIKELDFYHVMNCPVSGKNLSTRQWYCNFTAVEMKDKINEACMT